MREAVMSVFGTARIQCARQWAIASLMMWLIVLGHPSLGADKKSIEEKTKIHRLSTTMRTPYDAFVYVNRIPAKADESESSADFSGRIFSRLANQEGRVLIKLPQGMTREAYLGYKTFLSTDAKVSNGNCVACHAPEKFTDLKKHIVTSKGKLSPTPSLRNMGKRKVDLRKVLQAKLAGSKAKGVDAEYRKMHLNQKDLTHLEAFLKQLNDVSDKDFRSYILNIKILDTSGDIE